MAAGGSSGRAGTVFAASESAAVRRRGSKEPASLLLAALLSLALAAALWQTPALVGGGSAGRSATRADAGSRGAAGKGLSSLPLAAQGTISAAIGADQAAFRVTRSGGTLTARNPAQHLRASFASSGIAVSASGARLEMSLRAVGYGGSLTPVTAAAPRAHANRVIYERGDLSEWYSNGPLGLEQGFTLSRAPARMASGPLTLSLALSGAGAALDRGGRSLTFSQRGRPVLRYAALVASDARGRMLHSWLELRGTELLLRVDARGARYPLRIDPLLQHGITFGQQGSKLTGGGETGQGLVGTSVALSADGTTALVGGAGDNNFAGAAWVFVRSGSTWVQQGSKLTGGGEVGGGTFGSGVALSANGNTALIGGGSDNSSAGAAWVFTRSGSTWTQQGSKLTGGGETGAAGFGFGVALSADGSTAVVGGLGDNGGAGAVWVFTRSGSTWTQQGSKLTGTGEVGSGQLGFSVAVSADGNTALAGGRFDNKGAGAAWVFTRSGSTWSQQGSKLTGAGQTSGEVFFGASVALSADGSTALVGGNGNNGNAGAAWVFTRSGEAWAQQGNALTGSGESGEGFFGLSVALSADGHVALIGGPDDNAGVGAAWVFTLSGFTWTQRGTKLTGSGESGSAEFGRAVALSSDGNTALVGGREDNGKQGAAWIFTPKLTGTGGSGIGELGASAALSAEGNTALIGNRRDNGAAGAVWVFTRSGSTWTQQGEKLTGAGASGIAEFGQSVALSDDGNTALIGGRRDNSNAGAAWVFVRSGSTWSQQGSKLTGGGESGAGDFGASAALSADGNTALIGGYGDNSNAGAAWVFTRSGSTWTQQGTKLTGSGETGSGFLGTSAALSSDGNTALVGGSGDNGSVGAAWVFTRSGETWTQQGTKLTGSGETGAGGLGASAALSADGNTALLGGPSDNSAAGAAWVFTRSAGTWSQQGAKLAGGEESGAGAFGESAALSSNGNTALIGGSFDNSQIGAAWEFTRSGSTWTQQGEKLTGGGESGKGEFGQSAALSADGNTALIGGPDDGEGGAAWVFVTAPTVTKLKPTSGPVGGGTSVTITGTDLTGAWNVAFGGASAASFKVNSATSITAVAPPEAPGTVDVTVYGPDGTSAISTKDHFKFTPTVTNVSPKEGSHEGGTSVTVTGTGFALGKTATTFKFGTSKGTNVNCTSGTECTVTSPAHAAGTVDVTATVNKVASPKSSADKFTYL